MSDDIENSVEPSVVAPRADVRLARTGFLSRFSLLDLRFWIAVMFVIFGAMLAVYGAWFVTEEDLAKAAGLNLNLWTGLAMVVVGLLFGARAAFKDHGEDDVM